MIWMVLGAMTVGVVFTILMALAPRKHVEGAPLASDIALFHAQQEEIVRAELRGDIDLEEAASARTEIARRLLAVDRETSATLRADHQVPGTLNRRRFAVVLALFALPALTFGFYLQNGSPHLPSRPAAAIGATPLPGETLDQLMIRLERHLVARPSDAAGWDILANLYDRLGRATDAAHALRQAISAGGETLDRQLDLGQALATSAGGVITAEARAAFDAAARIEPGNPRVQFVRTLILEQDGKPDEAALHLAALVAHAPSDAPWLPVLREQLLRLIAPQLVDDTTKLEALSPEDRHAEVRRILSVSPLQPLTKQDDVSLWRTRILAFIVIDDLEQARANVVKAQAALAGQADASQALAMIVSQLNLGP